MEVNKAITIESKCWLAFWTSYWCWYKSQDLNTKVDCGPQVTEIKEQLLFVDKTIEEYLDIDIKNQMSLLNVDMARHLELIIAFLDTVHRNWRPLTINNIKAYDTGKPAMVNEVVDAYNWELINRYFLNDKSIKDGDDPEIVMLKSLMRIRQVYEKVRPVKNGKLVPSNIKRTTTTKDCMRIFGQIKYIDTTINISRQNLYSSKSNFTDMLHLHARVGTDLAVKELRSKWESSFRAVKVFTKNLYGLLFELEELIVFGSSSSWVTALNAEDLCDRLIVIHQCLARRNMEIYQAILKYTYDINNEGVQVH